MGEDTEDQLLENAGELYADWIIAGGLPGDPVAFESLCVQHPTLATSLKRLRAFDVGARRLAHEEGAAAGGLDIEAGLDLEGTLIADPDLAGPEEAHRNARDLMERVAQRDLSFGKYHLSGLNPKWSRVGQGGAGSVFRAWDEDLARRVALKLLHRRYVDPKSGVPPEMQRRAQTRFLREAQLTAQLDHPGIVPIHDFGTTTQGRPYFTMKLVRGKTLGEVIQLLASDGSSWTRTRVLGLFIKASEAVAYAHDKGVIHRDLKPANIMIGRFGEVYVMDWGLLKQVSGDEPDAGGITQLAAEPESPVDTQVGITLDGDALGTAAYMAPEQALGRLDEVDQRSDIYGLGAILYHVLSGAPPFTQGGTTQSVLSILEAHRQGDGPESIDAVAPRVPPELRRIVARAMCHAPADRYGTVGEMTDELLAFVEGRVGREWVSSPLRSSLRWIQRHKALAAALVMCTVLAGTHFLRSGPEVPDGEDPNIQPATGAASEGSERVMELVKRLVAARPEDRDALVAEIAAELQEER